jgi:hypothetical protein
MQMNLGLDCFDDSCLICDRVLSLQLQYTLIDVVQKVMSMIGRKHPDSKRTRCDRIESRNRKYRRGCET